MLWAWERPEDLRFLNSQNSGVAFLAGTASISTNGSVLFRLRTQRLLLSPKTPVLAVVRIETPLVHAAPETSQFLPEFERIANLPGVRGVQIDFDARASERSFYRTLLRSIHRQTSKPIGITALASWCEGDRWLDDEPVVEAIPMLFRLGRGESRDVPANGSLCRSSVGLATDEPWPFRRPAGIKRIYLFSPRQWTQQEYTRAIGRLESWK